MTQAQKTPLSSSRAFISLLREVDCFQKVWKHNGQTFTASEMIREIEEGSDEAIAYTQLLLHGTVKGLLENTTVVVPPATELDVSIPISTTVAEFFKKAPADAIAWHSMSKTWYAGEMPELLEKRDPDALTIVSDCLRVVRGWLERGVVRK